MPTVLASLRTSFLPVLRLARTLIKPETRNSWQHVACFQAGWRGAEEKEEGRVEAAGKEEGLAYFKNLGAESGCANLQKEVDQTGSRRRIVGAACSGMSKQGSESDTGNRCRSSAVSTHELYLWHGTEPRACNLTACGSTKTQQVAWRDFLGHSSPLAGGVLTDVQGCVPARLRGSNSEDVICDSSTFATDRRR